MPLTGSLALSNCMPVKIRFFLNSADDMQTEEEYYSYVFEMGRVYGENKLPQDIAEEIEKVKAADLIIFQVRLK